MNKIFFVFLLIFQIFSSCFNEDNDVSLKISRSNTNDKSGSLTPFVISLSSIDTAKKMKGVDLICIVDVSGSMYGNMINLVKETLKYLVSLMQDNDQLAIIPFNSGIPSEALLILTTMTENNKKIANNRIDRLIARGGTNIYAGLEWGLKEISNDYSSGERIASMILLSDGHGSSNTYTKFKQHINDVGKQNYTFTLHTLGYGESHGAELMHKISLNFRLLLKSPYNLIHLIVV